MSRYIDADALLRNTIYNPCHVPYITESDIISAPTADVVERKTGEWIEHERAEEVGGYLISNYECSCCHTWERSNSDYCPNCGSYNGGENEV